MPQMVTQPCTWTIINPLVITSALPPTPTVGSAYSHQYTATGGSGNYTWSIVAGALPPGFTLSPSGLLSCPLVSGGGTFNFVAQVSDPV